MGVPDTLEKAAKILEQFGWCQGYMQDDRGCFCAAGAIDVASFGSARYFSRNADAPEVLAAEDAHDALRRHLGQEIPHWNDTPNRTKEQVISELLNCADKVRREGK